MAGFHFLVFLHIVAGTTAILSGCLALSVRKGAARHRQAGIVFCLTMLSMSSAGAYLAFVGTPVKHAEAGNVVGGIFAFYLVTTAWSAARRGGRLCRVVDGVALLIAVSLASGAIAAGFAARRAVVDPFIGSSDGPYFSIAAVTLVLAASDVRAMVRGMNRRHRIARHLWRMGFALWVAASSLFLGQAEVFPDAFWTTGLLWLPSVAIFVATLFWYLRTMMRPQTAGASGLVVAADLRA